MKDILNAVLTLLAGHPRLEWLLGAFVRTLFEKIFSFGYGNVANLAPLEDAEAL